MSKLNKQDPDEYLLSLFEKHNRIYLGDELKEKIVNSLGKTNAAARKIIERFAGKGLILSSKPISFGRNTFAYYSLGRKITFDDLLGITRLKRPPIFRLLTAIKKCGGIISYYDALKITGSPLAKSKTKIIELETIISEIKFFGLIKQLSDKNKVKYLIANYVDPLLEESLMAHYYSLMLVDASLLYDVLISLSKLNLIDNKYIRYRNRKTPWVGAPHNNFTWDAFSYTRTTGINTIHGKRTESSIKRALVVIDMVVSRKYEPFDYEGFNSRIQVLHNNTRTERKILPVIVYREISNEVLNKARAFGMLTYNIAAFFGNKIYDVIDNIKTVKLSENSIQGITKDPIEIIAETLDIIDSSGNMINLQNLIGDFFQSLMYQLFHQIYPNCSIEQAKKLPAMDETSGRKKMYEYDMVINSVLSNELIVVELKGTMKNITISLGDFDKKNTLKWFFGRTFPSFAKHHVGPTYANKKIVSSFITSGKFDGQGKTYLADLNKGKIKPANIAVGYDGKELIKLANDNSLGLLKRTLEHYFVKID